MTLQSASQTTVGSTGRSKPAEGFRALMNQVNPEASAGTPSTLSANHALAAQVVEKRHGQSKEVTKTTDVVVTSAGSPVIPISQPVPVNAIQVLAATPYLDNGTSLSNEKVAGNASKTPSHVDDLKSGSLTFSPSQTLTATEVGISLQRSGDAGIPMNLGDPNGAIPQPQQTMARGQFTNESESTGQKGRADQSAVVLKGSATDESAISIAAPMKSEEIRPLADSSFATPAGQAHAQMAQEAGVQSSTIGENQPSILVLPDVLGTAVANVVPTSQTSADSSINVKLGKSTLDLSASTQPAEKMSAGDRKPRTQQKGVRELDLTDSVQSSSHDPGQAKQAKVIVQAANSVGQNTPVQSGPVAEMTATNAMPDTFKAHTHSAESTTVAAGAYEPTYSEPKLNPTSPLGSVQTAHLVQHLSESELRVGIQAGEFGKVDIRTSIGPSQISARIYVEHDELGKAMAEFLPQLHEKLSVEHRLDAQIELYSTGSSHSNGTDRQQHQQQQRTPEQNEPASRDADAPTPQVEFVHELSNTATTMGLDMHA